MLFELEQDEEGYPPASAETLWAIKVDDGLFKIDNMPFFALGIAVNDIVSATQEEGAFRFKEVVQPSGHSTLRVVVYDPADVPAVRALFKELGCETELSHLPRLLAVDVPPTLSMEELRKVLDSGRQQDRWGYEEACLAQP
ncbi:DUF4265 domain-containing protein [Stigmatella ashevillensis]|uniref:DUF4265 domain-containing protein n=1 Tax=Stigmatella ashevillensis TaxID=2995309 RepID=UPI00280BA846|nr:DUF4265 domain-containing protein [Stigmatella ashevillena]